MNMPVGYIKSFSKGQITIPKQMRDALGIGDEFWLKLTVDKGKIIAEPTEKKKDKSEYRKKLLKIKAIKIDVEELARNRKQIEDRLKKWAL